MCFAKQTPLKCLLLQEFVFLECDKFPYRQWQPLLCSTPITNGFFLNFEQAKIVAQAHATSDALMRTHPTRMKPIRYPKRHHNPRHRSSR